MRSRETLAAAALAALLLAGSAAAATRSSGSATNEGTTWTVADAIAFSEGDGEDARTVLVFSSVPFDRKDFARDRVIDADDPEWHFKIHPDARGFRLKLKAAAGEQADVDHLSGASSSGTYIDRPRSVRVSGGKAPRIAGKLADPDGGNAYAFDFDVPIEGEVEPSVDYLPDDGGEPGKVVTEFMDAHGKNEYARMFAMIHPQRDALLDHDKPTHSRYFAGAQRRTSCKKLLGFTGGYVYAEEALVAYSCPYSDDQELRGIAVLARAGAEWKVVGFLPENIYE